MKRTLFLLVTLIGMLQAQNSAVITVVDSVTRPYNITQYTANDVVNDSNFTRLLKFRNIIRTTASDSGPVVMNLGGGGIIVGATLTVGDSANSAGQFKLLLYRDTVSNVADNAAHTSAAINNTRYVAPIEFALENDGTTANYSTRAGLSIPFSCASDDRFLYGILLAKNAFQPVRAQKFIVKLFILRN